MTSRLPGIWSTSKMMRSRSRNTLLTGPTKTSIMQALNKKSRISTLPSWSYPKFKNQKEKPPILTSSKSSPLNMLITCIGISDPSLNGEAIEVLSSCPVARMWTNWWKVMELDKELFPVWIALSEPKTLKYKTD